MTAAGEANGVPAESPATPAFSGRVALVTGASRGIGFGIARRLSDEGARVVLTARQPDALATAVSDLGGPERALGVAGKADDPDHQAETIEQTLSTFGRLDMLVNNAGINVAYGQLIDLDISAARKIFEVNCLAALSWTQQVHHAWMAHHGGVVINMSSAAGINSAEGIGFYGASKAMLSHLTAQLAAELGPGIRVNAVAPALVKTDFSTALYQGREEQVASRYALKRLGVPEDVAGVVRFLLSPDAAWITGQTVIVDGGVTLQSGV